MRNTSNPKIKQYSDKRTGKPRYLVRYRKPDNTQTTKRGFLTKRDAEAWLTEIEGAKRRGEFVAVSAGRVPLRTVAESWLEVKRSTVKPSTMDGITSAWTTHIEPSWGDTLLVHIDTMQIASWTAGLPGSASTVRRVHAVLAQILDAAVTGRRLAVNPARGITLPRAQTRANRYLSHVEVQRVAEAAGRHKSLVYLLAYGGLRWGEAVALECRHIDGTRVRIDQAVTATRAGWVLGTPKTHERRSLRMPGFVARMIAEEIEGRAPDALVFPAERGAFLRTPGKVQRGRMQWWQAALVEAGIPYLRIHDLRHTAASLAVQAGAHVKAVQRMLGHESAAMTLDRYADLFDEDLEAVAGALDAARAAAVGHDLTTVEGDRQGSSGIERDHLSVLPGSVGV